MGTRLQPPYTAVFPKPLVPINNKPILEIVLKQLKNQGYKDIMIAVGHLAELIMAYFGDGSKYGIEISYYREESPLGTAGPLRMIKDELDSTFLLMNGDVLTTIDYAELLRHHKESGALTTVALCKRSVDIDFGVVEADDIQIRKWIEKPVVDYLVSMGIYVLEPEVIDFIPDGKFDFPDLVQLLIRKEKKVGSFIYGGYWLDIGRPEDYRTAIKEADKLIGDLL